MSEFANDPAGQPAEQAGVTPEEQGGAAFGEEGQGYEASLYEQLTSPYDETAEYEDETAEPPPTVNELAVEQRQYDALMDALVRDHPALETEAAVEAIKPIYTQYVTEYPEAAGDLELIRAIYNELGGDERFEHALIERDYTDAFTGPASGDPLTG